MMASDTNILLNILIRDFRMEDYEALIQLWNDAQLPHKPRGRDRRDKIEAELKRGNALFLVAEAGGAVVGSILGTHDGRKGWINRLAVAPLFRNRGIARKLVSEVEKRLSERGIEIVACLIEDWNEVSMLAFERLGYVRHPEVVYFSKRRNSDV